MRFIHNSYLKYVKEKLIEIKRTDTTIMNYPHTLSNRTQLVDFLFFMKIDKKAALKYKNSQNGKSRIRLKIHKVVKL